MPSKYVFWSTVELEKLEELFFLGFSDNEICKRLNKTYESVKYQRRKYGLTRYALKHFTDEEVIYIADNMDEDMHITAEKLGRPYGSVVLAHRRVFQGHYDEIIDADMLAHPEKRKLFADEHTDTKTPIDICNNMRKEMKND